MQQYAGWEPKEFAEQPKTLESSWQPQEFQEDQPSQQPSQQAHPEVQQQGQLGNAAADFHNHQLQHQQAGSGQFQQGLDPGHHDRSQEALQQPELQQAQWQASLPNGSWNQLKGPAGDTAQHAQEDAHTAGWQASMQRPNYEAQQQHASDQAAILPWQQPQMQLSAQLDSNQSAGVGDTQTAQVTTAGAQSQQPAAEQDTSQPGFVYDSASGYWHDAVSGYYYDANTGLYCHPQTQQWYSQDPATGEFTPYAAAQTISTAGANALGESQL